MSLRPPREPLSIRAGANWRRTMSCLFVPLSDANVRGPKRIETERVRRFEKRVKHKIMSLNKVPEGFPSDNRTTAKQTANYDPEWLLIYFVSQDDGTLSRSVMSREKGNQWKRLGLCLSHKSRETRSLTTWKLLFGKLKLTYPNPNSLCKCLGWEFPVSPNDLSR